MNDHSFPHVAPDLLSYRLDGQLLVYDRRGDQVHLLDAVTARVFEMVQEGGWTSSRASEEIARLSDAGHGEDLLELSLDELRKANLLIDADNSSLENRGLRRRELLKKVAAAGAIAAAIPGILTVTASGQTGSCFPKCHGCLTDDQCCGALICASARVSGHLVANVCVSGITPPIDICASVIL